MTELPEEQPVEPKVREIGVGKELLLVGSLVLVAVAVRAYIVCVTHCVSSDTVGYLTLAQYLREGEFGWFFANVQHHLYPVLLFGVQEVFGASLLAAEAFSIALGSLAVVPFYLLARNVFGMKAAAASSFFFAFHVILARTCATVCIEPLYLFTFLFSLYAGKRAIDVGRPFLFAITGFLLGLTFMARPEGLGLWVLLGGWVLLIGALKVMGHLILRREYDPSGGRLLAGFVLMVAVTCITTSPHFLAARLVDGKWRLTRKHAMWQIMRGEPVYSPSRKAPSEVATPEGRVRYALKCLDELADESLWAYHLPSTLPLFYLLGVFCRRSRPRDTLGELILASVVIAYPVAVLQFMRVHHYLTERHLISSAVLVLMWAGAGFWATSELIARLLARCDKLERAPARITVALLMLLTLGTMSVKTLRHMRSQRANLPELGAQIRGQFPPRKDRATRIASFVLPRVVFYAGGQQLRADRYIHRLTHGPEKAYESFMQRAPADEPDLLLLQLGEKAGPRDVEIYEALKRKNVEPDQTLDYEDGNGTWRLLIYRFDKLPPPGTKTGAKEE